MDKCIVYPFSDENDFLVSPSVAFDACGMWRMDAAAEQFVQRLASRKVFVVGHPLSTAMHEPELRTAG